MLFSLVAPTITFYSERKYTITIADNETITMKVPVFQSRISEAALKWRQHFDELSELKNFTAQQSFKNATLLLSGPAKTIGTMPKHRQHLQQKQIKITMNTTMKPCWHS
jgi:hypothetical protein